MRGDKVCEQGYKKNLERVEKSRGDKAEEKYIELWSEYVKRMNRHTEMRIVWR